MKKISMLMCQAVLLFSACTTNTPRKEQQLPEKVQQMIATVRTTYAPDSRVALFQTQQTSMGNKDKDIVLRGVTTVPEAKQELINLLQQDGWHAIDSMAILPDTVSLRHKTYGVVNLSVANIRRDPDFSSEMVTQALLGTPIHLLERDGWYRVQTPDEYIGWTHGAGIFPMTQSQYNEWNAAPKLIVTTHYGFAYSLPRLDSQTTGDIVSGDRFRLIDRIGDFFVAAYPNGRITYIPRQMAMAEQTWRATLRQDATSIIATARTLLGVPYLWAGMSAKGMDCSGFIRTILFLHDIILPRDASQMCQVGERLDIVHDYSNLMPGDLLFFGRKATADTPERVVHVGMYIGNKQFIHSQGYVMISSFDPTSPLYDEYNLQRYLFATRFLNANNHSPGITTTDTNPYYLTEPIYP